MKKIMLLLLVFALIGCSAPAEENDWYLETAMEFAGKVGELAKDDAYIELMGGMSLECLEQLKSADYTHLISAHRCKMPDEAGVRVLLQAVAGWDISDAALEAQIAKLPVLPITMHNGEAGTEEVAASVMLTYSRTYVMPQDFVPCTYVLEMDGAVTAVAFCATGADTVTVSAQPLLGADGAGIDDLLADFVSGNVPMEIEKVY